MIRVIRGRKVILTKHKQFLSFVIVCEIFSVAPSLPLLRVYIYKWDFKMRKFMQTSARLAMYMDSFYLNETRQHYTLYSSAHKPLEEEA